MRRDDLVTALHLGTSATNCSGTSAYSCRSAAPLTRRNHASGPVRVGRAP